MQSQTTTAFFGRTAELRTITGRLHEAVAGRGGLVLLAGEPGIGKTRLAEETAAGAVSLGVRILWGRCYEGQGAPAFWPWVQVLRTIVRDRDPTALRAELDGDTASLAALVPELDVGSAADESPRLQTAEERFRLFAAVATLLIATATTTPLLIIIDDMHWADAPSLLLFEFVARELGAARLLLMGTFRDTEVRDEYPLSRTLGRLARLPHGVRLGLRGLPAQDVAAVIAEIAGAPASIAMTTAVSEVTEGNPFFVGEIARFQIGAARLAGDVTLAIPPSLHEVIGLRIGDLSPACSHVLTLAAVVGREFPLRALEQVSESHGAQALEVLEEAESARIITAGATPGSYRFVHALIRETLYDAIPSLRRARLHRQVGEALEQLWSNEPEHLNELAWHFTRAAPAGDVMCAVSYAHRAADYALSLLAYEESVRFYQMALDALDLDPRAGGLLRCQLLLALGQVHILSGDTRAGQAAYWRTVDLARALREHGSGEDIGPLLAGAAVGIGRLTLLVQPAEPRLNELLIEALQALGEADSLLRVQVLGQMASNVGTADGIEQRQALSHEAVAIARRLGDARALAVALLTQHNVLRGPDNHERQLATATEALQLAEAAGDATLMLLAYRVRVVDLTEMGDFTAFEHDRTAHERLARRTRDPYHIWLATLWQAMSAQLDGRWQEALELADQALVLGQHAETDLARLYYALQIAAVRREHGPIADGLQVLHDIPASYPLLDGLGAVLAELLVTAGDIYEARIVYQQALPPALRGEPAGASEPHNAVSPQRSGHWLLTMPHFAHVASALGDLSSAAALYDVLRPYAGRFVMASPGAVGYGAVSYYLGVLASALCHDNHTTVRSHRQGAASMPTRPELPTWDDAERHLVDAMTVHARIGARAWLARSQYVYACMLCDRTTTNDIHSTAQRTAGTSLARAEELLVQAAGTADALGMERLASEVAVARADIAMLTRTAGAAIPASTRALPDRLTAREADVLRLLAAGQSNKQIAELLVLSVATVRGHTISIYSKIGASGRAAATAFALQHGILPPDTD